MKQLSWCGFARKSCDHQKWEARPILKSFGKAEMEPDYSWRLERQQLNHLEIWKSDITHHKAQQSFLEFFVFDAKKLMHMVRDGELSCTKKTIRGDECFVRVVINEFTPQLRKDWEVRGF